MLARIRSYWQGLFRRAQVEQDLGEEVASHIAERAKALEKSGSTPAEALQQARLEFGAAERFKEDCREARGLRWPDELVQDLRYAVRMFRGRPGVTVVAVLSLAIGIGANTAIFSILNSLLLTTLPVRDPASLVILQKWRPEGAGSASYPLYLRLREGLRGGTLEDVCATSSPGPATIALPGADPAKAVQENVSANFFDVLGVPLIAGHSFGAAEEKIGSAPVAVISERFWKGRLASDPAILGKALLMDDRPVTVIGVSGGEFTGIEIGNAVDVWTNVTAGDTKHMTQGGWNFLTLLGRLKRGVSHGQAQAALTSVFTAFQQEQERNLPEFKRKRQSAERERLSVENGATGISRLRQRFALPLRIVMGVVALVLLIACANITNLLLARAAARQREIATRLSLGAGSSRLFRQFLTESLMLALCGGVMGLAVAAWTSRHLLDLIPRGSVPLVLDVHLSGRVLLFTSAVAIGAGLLFGIVPAMRVARSQLSSALKLNAASDFGGARGALRPGKLLSVFQVTLATLLVFGAGLFVRTLANLRSVDAGFRAEHVVTFDLIVPRTYTSEQKQDAQHRVVERLRSVAGILDASVSWPGPFNGGRFSGGIRVPGVEIPEDSQHDVDYMLVDRNFFPVLGATLLAGRLFDARETAPSTTTNADVVNPSNVTAVIINESFARTYFAGKNPVGLKIQPFPRSPQPVIADIVGVVRNVRHYGLRDQAGPAIYLPITEMERMLATVASLFGFVALLLAGVGLFGVMAYAVTRRTKEIGLRMALGAQRRQVLDMILVDGAVVAMAGVALGVPAALALSRYLSSVLFGVKPSDAGSLLTPLAVLLTVAIAAVLIPAWRAARVDPMTALRDE